jgi:hypothetical protein
MPFKKGDSTAVAIPKPKMQIFKLPIVGVSSLICHNWSEKAKKQMRDKQMKKATSVREAKDPEQCFRDSLYPHPDGGFGFPAIAFKKAAVDACSLLTGITKVKARAAFHVVGPLIKIEGEPTMREDMVVVGIDTADLRYRGEFLDWSAELLIRHNPDILSVDQIVNLLMHAGFSIGIGEHRVEKNGDHGMFEISAPPPVGANGKETRA